MSKLNVSLLTLAALAAAGAAAAADDGQTKKLKGALSPPQAGVVVLSPTKNNDVRGIIFLRQQEDGVLLTGKVKGLSPGKHGFHIHQFGDLRDPQGKSAGGHFNPTSQPHGAPDDPKHHVGDLGNIEANAQGVADVKKMAKGTKLHFLLGRSLVVHGGADDLESQPSGDAGPRVALGVIGVAQTKPEERSSGSPKQR